ncbi:MAG: alpha/beta hydrolase [Rhodocyclaceae bacterium]|nr:alpha/beta hydrolase [Rhodocyclaceae bacterium]
MAGLDRFLLEGRGFQHLAYRRNTADHQLHVYLEGDGLAWLRPQLPSADPTPYRPLMFDAMLVDRGTTLYLGRPCQFVGLERAACTPLAWTHGRYSPAVVNSLATALQSHLAHFPATSLVFFGHSGGGTLATLLAARFPQTAAVVTVAANLDVDAWTARHAYSKLAGSLDPARQPPLAPSVRQWHLAGREDREVPPVLARRYLAANAGAWFSVIDGFDHSCCWLGLWPGVLRVVSTMARAPTRP